MTDRRWRFSYAFFGVVLLVALVVALDVNVDLSLSSGLWSETIIWLLLGAFVLEPRFTGAPTAATNAVGAIFVFLGTDTHRFSGWWDLLLAMAVVALVLVVVPYLMRSSEESLIDAQRARLLSRLGTRVGSWRCLPLGVLILSLVSFQRPYSNPWLIAGVMLLYTFGIAAFEPHQVFAAFTGKTKSGLELGVVRLCPPAEAIVTGEGAASLAPGTTVSLDRGQRSAAGLVLGPTFYDSSQGIRVLVPTLYSVVGPNGAMPEIRRGVPDDDTSQVSLLADEMAQPAVSVAGVVAEGSAIREARIELSLDVMVSVGQVVWTLEPSGRVYWQVSDAEVARSAWAGDGRRIVLARAAQIGMWDDIAMGFVPVMTSPRNAAVVLSGEVAPPRLAAMTADRVVVGHLPGTSFPIVADLAQLSRHHFALLGTTGTGKTHLSFLLITALANAGVKVICVDGTGQYAVAFPPGDAEHITKGSVSAFLAGPEKIAVYTPDPARDSIAEGRELSTNLFNWARQQPILLPTAPARVMLVFEEAQNYVPEGFVVESFKRKEMAQDTSRLVMESRKFGLGFGLISQRTAMVTKSALSQCGTLFAFQAVDQTNIDYLGSLCGMTLARGIPTLEHRTAVALGRGLTSRAPVITTTADAPIQIA